MKRILQNEEISYQDKVTSLFKEIYPPKFLLEKFSNQMNFLIKAYLPELEKRFNEVKFNKPLTLSAFHRICQAENISVIYRENTVNKYEYGSYVINSKTLAKTIYLSSALSKKAAIRVGAHELAHHFLHQEKLLNRVIGQGVELYLNAGFSNEQIKQVDALRAEIEADLFAAMLLIGGKK